MIGEAARGGANLVLFPEVFMAWLPEQAGLQAKRRASQPLDGPFVRGLADAAREAGVWVVSGMLEAAPANEPRVYNTTVVIDDVGNLVASYRKTHLYDAFGFMESETIAPGDDVFEPIETPWGRMGLFVCYELRFPEIARYQAERGVDFFLVPSGWVNGPMKELHWRSLVLARAIENTAYVVACDQVHNVFLGRSLIVDPMGVVLAEGTETEGMLYAELDARRIAAVRARVPSISHRRTDLFRPRLVEAGVL
jgi:predicted amidohydrolase